MSNERISEFLFHDPKHSAADLIGYAEQYDAQDEEAAGLIAELAAHLERAQAEIDAANTVTDAMVDAYTQAVESSHDSDISADGLLRLRRLGLEAALKAQREARSNSANEIKSKVDALVKAAEAFLDAGSQLDPVAQLRDQVAKLQATIERVKAIAWECGPDYQYSGTNDPARMLLIRKVLSESEAQ